MKKKEKKASGKKDPSGLFVLAGLFIGLGVGMIVNEMGIGALIGLGVGFLIVAVMKLFKKP